MSKVFISYRRSDSRGAAGRIYDRLKECFGERNVFRDVDAIEPGQEFAKVISERVGASDVLIALIGIDWMTVVDAQGQVRIRASNDYVRMEISTALKLGKKVIPTLVDGAKMPKREELPEEIRSLADRNAIEITDQRFDYDVGELIKGIDPRALTKFENARQPKAAVSATSGGIVVGGKLTVDGSNGGTAIVTTGDVTIGLTVGQLEQALARKEKAIREELSRVNAEDKQRVAILEKELVDALQKSQNLEASLKEHQTKLTLATQNLDRFKLTVPKAEIDRAKQSLARGDTSTAEDLLRSTYAASTEQAAEAAFQLGELAHERIDYTKAHEYYAEAVRLRPENSHYLTKLGEILYELGRHSQALPWLNEALTIRRQVFGLVHLKVAENLNDIAGVYCAQGNYSEAEPLYQESLAIRRKLLGSEHPEVASALNNIGEKCREIGEWERAALFYQEALAIFEKTYGRQHRDVAAVLNNLGKLYYAQGLFEKAEPLFEEALEIDTRLLPPNHPDTATDLNSLGVLYFAKQQWHKAEEMHIRAIDIRNKSLPVAHADSGISFYNLARVHEVQGKLKKAEPLFRRALDILEQTLPPGNNVLSKVNEKYAEIIKKLDKPPKMRNRNTVGKGKAEGSARRQ